MTAARTRARWYGAILALLWSSVLPSRSLQAQNARPPDVRQIVTFLFQPGRAGAATDIYERNLRPAYQSVPEVMRVRAFREAESPEPLDLIVVTTYAGMAGMDAANRALRAVQAGERSVFAWYGVLGGMTQSHHDQFAEMIPKLGDAGPAADDTAAGLVVFEYVRLTPGSQQAFEHLLESKLRRLEHDRQLARWSETGRLLVSDGWDYVRFIGLDSLGAWQRYLSTVRESSFAGELAALIAARKTIIVRQEPRLFVR